MSSASLHAASAAESLYERYYDPVYGFCLYQLGSREEAEDAAQTTFLSALGALERGVVPRREASWLFTIARNTCRARFRSRGVRRARELLADPQLLEAVAPGTAAGGEELFSLAEALADMPEQQRRAIVLREWRGCSYAEIADELGLSASAVETLIFRARRSLAQRLEYPTTSRLSALGSLGAALKSLLGLGSAAKMGVAASTVAALAIGFGVPSDVERTPPVPAAPTRVQVSPAGVAVPDEKPARVRHREPKQLAAPPSVETAPVETATPAVVPVEPLVDDVNATVDDVKGVLEGIVDDTVNPLLPPELQLPDVRLPDLLG